MTSHIAHDPAALFQSKRTDRTPRHQLLLTDFSVFSVAMSCISATSNVWNMHCIESSCVTTRCIVDGGRRRASRAGSVSFLSRFDTCVQCCRGMRSLRVGWKHLKCRCMPCRVWYSRHHELSDKQPTKKYTDCWKHVHRVLDINGRQLPQLDRTGLPDDCSG